jgi:hypothetical protein
MAPKTIFGAEFASFVIVTARDGFDVSLKTQKGMHALFEELRNGR